MIKTCIWEVKSNPSDRVSFPCIWAGVIDTSGLFKYSTGIFAMFYCTERTLGMMN